MEQMNGKNLQNLLSSMCNRVQARDVVQGYTDIYVKIVKDGKPLVEGSIGDAIQILQNTTTDIKLSLMIAKQDVAKVVLPGCNRTVMNYYYELKSVDSVTSKQDNFKPRVVLKDFLELLPRNTPVTLYDAVGEMIASGPVVGLLTGMPTVGLSMYLIKALRMDADGVRVYIIDKPNPTSNTEMRRVKINRRPY